MFNLFDQLNFNKIDFKHEILHFVLKNLMFEIITFDFNICDT